MVLKNAKKEKKKRDREDSRLLAGEVSLSENNLGGEKRAFCR